MALFVAVLNNIAPITVPNPITLVTLGNIINVLIPIAPCERSSVALGAAVPTPIEPAIDTLPLDVYAPSDVIVTPVPMCSLSTV